MINVICSVQMALASLTHISSDIASSRTLVVIISVHIACTAFAMKHFVRKAYAGIIVFRHQPMLLLRLNLLQFILKVAYLNNSRNNESNYKSLDSLFTRKRNGSLRTFFLTQ